MSKTELLAIGGSDAGLSAVLRAREINPAVRPLMVLADEYPNFSICGIPFYLSREVPDHWHLAHRTRDEIETLGIEVRTSTRAISIDPVARICHLRLPDGSDQAVGYQNVVIGTGAESVRPAIEGLDEEGVFTLRWIDEALAINSYIESHRAKNVILIGAGYINLELTEGLSRRRLEVTLIERNPTVLKTVDADLGTVVEAYLRQHGVIVRPKRQAKQISRVDEGRLEVLLDNDERLTADLVVVAVGARAQTALAHDCGVALGETGAIHVNARMETNLPGIYAAGDCAETLHRMTGRPTYLPLGSTSHKQGRVAGENATGGRSEFRGTVGTQVLRVFDLVAARTGLNDSDARRFGFDPWTLGIESWDHKIYYPGAKRIHIRLTGDRSTGRLLGVQMVGPLETQVAKRIDTVAAALYAHLNVRDLNDLDLSYSPPLYSPWDPLQVASQEWLREVSTKIDLSVRTQDARLSHALPSLRCEDNPTA